MLRNMCNGMRGKNTQKFTYSGKLSRNSKRQKRRAAGCVGGYCARQNITGMNSCDEVRLGVSRYPGANTKCTRLHLQWPPASTEQGGNATKEELRAVNCIPARQNSYQGGVFSQLLKTLEGGDEFIISIDCDDVLGSIVPRDAVDASGTLSSSAYMLIHWDIVLKNCRRHVWCRYDIRERACTVSHCAAWRPICGQVSDLSVIQRSCGMLSFCVQLYCRSQHDSGHCL